MTRTVESIAGLRTLVVSMAGTPRAVVVVLHGYAMRPEDLAPFAESIGIPAAFYLPEGPLDAEPAGRAWWPVDHERRNRALESGPRDLHDEHPAGAVAARELLIDVLAEVGRRHAGLPLVLVGFSQGGMLACDAFLRDRPAVSGLALLSASRISADEWIPLASRFGGLPILVSQGTVIPTCPFAPVRRCGTSAPRAVARYLGAVRGRCGGAGGSRRVLRSVRLQGRGRDQGPPPPD